MADAGFGAEIGRDEDSLRWVLATPDAVSEPGDWAATVVTGLRAVTIAPGQGQAAQVTMPGGVGAKTDSVTLPLPFTGNMTYQGKLICRELEWYGIDQDPAGESRFVVLDAGNFAAWPSTPPSLSTVAGFLRNAGDRYLVPLHFAAVHQTSNEVQLWDFRNWVGRGPRLWFSASTRSATTPFTVPANARYQTDLQTFRVPDRRTGVLRVHAVLPAYMPDAAAAGWLRLWADGVLHAKQLRIHNNNVGGAHVYSWVWNVPLGAGEHTARVDFQVDNARAVVIREFQVSTDLEI